MKAYSVILNEYKNRENNESEKFGKICEHMLQVND